MEKPKFFSWEFLDGKVENPYEAVIAISRESRRLNSVPYELQSDKFTKKTTLALISLFDDDLKFEYIHSDEKK